MRRIGTMLVYRRSSPGADPIADVSLLRCRDPHPDPGPAMASLEGVVGRSVSSSLLFTGTARDAAVICDVLLKVGLNVLVRHGTFDGGLGVGTGGMHGTNWWFCRDLIDRHGSHYFSCDPEDIAEVVGDHE